MRTVKVYSTSLNPPLQEFILESNTWLELAAKVGINMNSSFGRGRQTKSVYDHPDALINTDDELIFIGAKKYESGSNDDNLDEQLEILKVTLRAELYDLIEEIFEDIDKKISESQQQPSVSQEDCPECTELLAEAKKLGMA